MQKYVIAEGTDYEREITLQKPLGRRARYYMPKVLSFMKVLAKYESEFSGADSDEVDILKLIDIIRDVWDFDEFEEVLVPYVLNLEDEDGRDYLNNYCNNMDILTAFMFAANWMIDNQFNREDTQEALGKSNEEAPEAQ